MKKLQVLISAMLFTLCLIPAGSISLEATFSQDSSSTGKPSWQTVEDGGIPPEVIETLPQVQASAEVPGWNPRSWRAHASPGALTRYRDVYPGIDLVYLGDERKLKAALIVSPGADTGSIRLIFPEARSFEPDVHGNMVVRDQDGTIGVVRPWLSQRIGARTIGVEGSFQQVEKEKLGVFVGDYDPTERLVIQFQLLFVGDDDALVVDRAGRMRIVSRRPLTRPASLLALVPTVTATKSDMLFVDNDSDMKADPGDTLKYTVVINASGMDAMGVMFSDMVDANTTFVNGSVKTSPIAFNDTYTASGNIGISITAPGVLSNDIDPDTGNNTGLTVTQVQGSAMNVGVSTATTATGIGSVTGFVTLNSNGSFSYEPPPGYTGNDTFTYTISDGDFSDTGTVTITISEMVWFINNSAGGSNRGTFSNPFTSIASFNAVNTGAAPNPQPGQFIALRRGTGTYSETDGINLQDDQKLIGEAVQFNTVFTAAANSIAAYTTFAGGTMTAPTITTTAGHGVDLASSNTVRGLNVGNTPGFFGFNGGAVGSPTINTVNVTGTGGAINIASSGAFGMNVTFNTLESTSSPGAGINLNNVTGTLGVTSGGTGISGSGLNASAININFGSVNMTYPGNVTKSNAGSLLNVSNGHTGTLTFNTGTLSATMGDGLQFNNADGTYNFNGPTTLSGGAVVNITNNSAGMFSFGTGTSITAGNNVVPFTLNGGTATVTYSGGITKTNNGAAIVVQGGHTMGTVTFQTGTLSITGGAGLQFDNADSTTSYNFTGTTTLNGGDAGIDILNGSSGTFTFNSNTTITSPSGTAFNVSGGSPAVTYSGSITQNTSNQRVVNIDGTTGGTITFNTGTITGGKNSTGININNANGNVSFANMTLGAGTPGDRMTNQAVTISGGTGTYSLGAISIFTNNVQGIVATNADGTLNSTSGTVDATSATAINIDGPMGLTTLGMTLTRVDSAGGMANGISLQDTNGSFTVNGDGSNTSVGGNGSGGTISGKSGSDGSTTSGIGVYLNNVSNITLRRMTINGTNQNFGIFGERVNGFTMEYARVEGANGTSTSGDGEGSVYFIGTGTNAGLSGSASINQSIITGGRKNSVYVKNFGGTLDRLTLSNSSFATSTATGPSTNDAVLIEAVNSGTTLNVTSNSCTYTTAGADLFKAIGQTSTTMDVVFTSNTVSNNYSAQLSGATSVNIGSLGTMTYNVTGNTMRDARSSALFVNKGVNPTGTMTGEIENNTIGVSGVTRSGSLEGDCIQLEARGGGTHTTLINNNTLRQYSQAGIHLTAGEKGAAATGTTLNATVTNNTTSEGSTNMTFPAFAGFWLDVGVNIGDNNTVCLSLTGNNFSAGDPFNASDIFLSQNLATTTVRLPSYGGGATDSTAVANFLIANNNVAGTTASATALNVVGGAACMLPPVEAPDNLTARETFNRAAAAGEVESGGTSAANVNGQRPSSFVGSGQSLLNLSTPIGLAGSASRQASATPALLGSTLTEAVTSNGSQCSSAPNSQTILVTNRPEAMPLDNAPPAAPKEAGIKDQKSAVSRQPSDSSTVAPVGSDGLSATAALPPDVWKGSAFPETTPVSQRATPALVGAAHISNQRAPASRRLAAHPAAEPQQSQHTRPKTHDPRLNPSSQSSAENSRPLQRLISRQETPGLETAPARSPLMLRPVSTTLRNSLAPDVNVNIGTLPAGKSVTITFRATVVAVPTAAQVCNQGTVSGSNFSNVLTDDPDVGGASDPTCTMLDLQADVEIVSKTDMPDPVIAGNNITYTIQFRNNGPNTATNVTVTDAVPMNTTFVSAMVTSGSGWMRTDSVMAGGMGNIVFAKPTVANGETAEFQITVKVNSSAADGSMITNTATADSNVSDPTPANDSKTAMTTVSRQVDLVVTKMESIDPVVAGSGAGNLTYIVKVMNNGPSDASGVTLSEVITVPAGVTVDSVTPSQGSFVSPTWTVGNLTSGAMATLTVVLTAGPSAAPGTDVICDTATVTASNETRTNTGDDADTECTSVTRQVDLVVTKMESLDPVVAGSGAGNLTYTIKVMNNGPSDASGVSLSEDLTLPAGVMVDSITPSVGMFTTTTAPDGTWTVGNLATGAMATLTVVLTVGPSAASGTDVVCDTATVTASNETRVTTGDDADTECTSVTRQVDLVVSKTESAVTVTAGSGTGNLTYTITVTNAGPSDASGVTLSEVLTLPAGVTVDSITPSQGSFVSPTWTVGNLASGAMATLTVVLTVGPSAATGTDTICDTATVTASNETRINTGDDADTECTSVTRSADLVVTKTESADPVAAGSNGGMNNLAYTITVENNGPSSASGITLSEVLTLPAGVTVSSVTPSQGMFVSPTWAVGDLPAGAMATLTVVLNVSAATADNAMISNTATITAANETDPGPGANSATETTTVRRVAELELTKTESVDPVIAGSNGGVNNLTYTVKITNNGPSPATGVVVTETLVMPAGVTLSPPAAPSKGSYVVATGVWTIGNLAVGEMATLTLVLNVSATAANGAVIQNTAAITAANEADPDTSNNSRTENTTVQRQADVAITKTDSVDPIQAGSLLTYTLKVTNGTLSEATSVTVTDTLNGSDFDSITTTQGSCTFNQPTKTVTCTLGSLPVSAMATITLKVVVVQIGVISNTATVTANEVDPTPGNNSDTELTTVTVPTGLPGVATAAVPVPVEVGDEKSDQDRLQQPRGLALLITDFANDQVVMQVSQRDGTFRRRATMLVGDGPTALVLGDFNRDGLADAAVANELSNTVSILLGDQDGSFQRQRVIIVGQRPTALGIGDLNHDSFLDLVVANFAENTVLVLLGQGDGRFQLGRRATVGTGPTGVAVGDFDADGVLDVAVSNFISNDVTILKGRGDGTFDRRGTVLVGGEGPMGIAVADLNEDGKVELVTVNFTTSDVTILKPSTNRVGFEIDKRLAVGKGPVAMVVAELLTNRPGFATTNLISANVTVQPGDGSSGFGRMQTYTTLPLPIALTLGDFNGDGRLDLAVLDADGQTVRVLFDGGDGRFKLTAK
jgi:uncharacterized repeat protein (TIGR01451 family)